MEDMLKDVVIRELTVFGYDTVFIVDNLPKTLLYRRVPKMMIDYTDIANRQNLVPAFEVMENGAKRRTGEMTDELLPGIELNNEGHYVFEADLNEARERLKAIDHYIEMVSPVLERIPGRVRYAAQPGNTNSAPITRNQIPRVVLPELVSPPVDETAQVSAAPRVLGEGHIPQAPANRQIPNPDALQAKRDRMAKARAAKAAKASNK